MSKKNKFININGNIHRISNIDEITLKGNTITLFTDDQYGNIRKSNKVYETVNLAYNKFTEISEVIEENTKFLVISGSCIVRTSAVESVHFTESEVPDSKTCIMTVLDQYGNSSKRVYDVSNLIETQIITQLTK